MTSYIDEIQREEYEREQRQTELYKKREEREVTKVRAFLLIGIETSLSDDPENRSDANTLRYLVEEDLKDLGYDIYYCEPVMERKLDKYLK